MTYKGTVKGRVVLLEPGAELQDGTIVHIEPEASNGNGLSTSQTDLFSMGDLAAETGIPDLATNADHYIYGHPKIGHGG